MALTALSTYVDPPATRGTVLPRDEVIEFCRNERGREIIKVFVITTPADGTEVGEEITLRLMKARRNRLEEVVQARKVFTIPTAMPVGGWGFEFDLRTINFATDKPWPIVRRGDYFVTIEHSGGTTGPTAVNAETKDFRVTLYTTDKFEREWLFGATRRSNDDRAVRQQPVDITGVKVVEVNRNYPLDIYDLSLVVDPNGVKFLVWDKGEAVKIETVIPDDIHRRYFLTNRSRNNFINVQVDPRVLPNTNVTARVFIGRDLIDLETLREAIDEELDWLENDFLFMPIEPSRCVSDFTLRNLSPSAGSSQGPAPLPENSDYDFKGPGITFVPPTPGHWIELQVPFANPLHFDYLVGALENSRIVDINPGWIHVSSARTISLIPFNQSLAYHFMGLMYVSAVRGPVELPSFWRYRYIAGIETDKTPKEILQLIKIRAAEKVLSMLGQAFRGGYGSESISRDGVSESVSYTSSAMYGIYSATIADIRERRKVLEPQIQRKYFGLQLWVL